MNRIKILYLTGATIASIGMLMFAFSLTMLGLHVLEKYTHLFVLIGTIATPLVLIGCLFILLSITIKFFKWFINKII